MNKLNRMKNKGFTLLELLVVIGIIGILVSLITVSFSNAQKSSRDSRRRQDLVSIQNAMEQYYAANSFLYPVANCSGTTCSALSTYLSGGTIVDPLNTVLPDGRSFRYSYTSSATSYSVTACLEKAVDCSAPNLLSVTNLQ